MINSKLQIPNTKHQRFRFWNLVLGIWILLLAGCGSGSDTPQGIIFSESLGDAGYLHLSLSGATSPHLSEVGTIVKYKVRLEGDDFPAIEQMISKEAGGFAIQNIPAGKKRRITLSALNRYGQILREGVLENIDIENGKTGTLEIELKAVPVFLNLHDGRHLSNRRLYFHLLTDPNHRLSFLETTVEADAQGIAKIYPGVMEAGDPSFEIFDDDSGKGSRISLHLWEGSGVKGAPLFAAGQTRQKVGDVFGGRLRW